MKSFHAKKIALAFSFMAFSIHVFSQENRAKFPFHHIEFIHSDKGLNGSEVMYAMQDHNGFLWFITDVALNRYDGYTFRSYSYIPEDSNSLSAGWYWGLAEDNNGTIWITSLHQGLYGFNSLNEKFYHYRWDTSEQTIAHKQVLGIAIQDDSVIWLGTHGGLDKFNPRTNVFTHFYHDDADSSTVSFNHIFRVVYDERKLTGEPPYLWLLNRQGFDCFNTATGKVIGRYLFPYASDVSQWSYASLFSNSPMNNGMIWIGSDDSGIYGFDTGNKKFVQIKSDHKCNSAMRHLSNTNNVGGYYGVMEDHAGNLWTTNDNNEIVYYHRALKKYYYRYVDESIVKFLDLPPYIFEDRSHRIWICTNNGLITVDARQKNIMTCLHDEKDPQSISSNFIYGIFRLPGNGPLLVGANTIDVFDRKTNSFSPLNITDQGKKIDTRGLWQFTEDRKKNLWLSGQFGLIYYEPRSGKSRLLKVYNERGQVKSREFIGVIEDKDGNLWSPNWGMGLCHIDPSTGKLLAALMEKDGISTSHLGTIFCDSKGTFYTCGWEGGFITFNPGNKTFKIFHHNPKDESSVSNETAHLFYETGNGLIWFGTLGGGLGVFDPITEKFKSFTAKDGLVHNSISSLVQDKSGKWWAATRGGLSCFTMPENPFDKNCKIKFRNYDISDGLPSNQLQMTSAYCDTDGTLFFGTRGEGLFYFHPDHLEDNSFIPPVYITDFSLLNKSLSIKDSNTVLKLPVEFTKEIQLNYRQNMFSFTFTALNYIHPEKNKYAYMLEGFDKSWIYTDASKRFASYTNLDAGEYVFKVKGSNNDGIWNEKPTELRIIITPPFWKTAWFKILLIASLLAIAYSFYRYRIGQIILLERIRNKIAADLHDDIGSTLNSISVYSEVARKDESRKEFALKMIGESSRKIIDSMSDIVWSINPENDNFDKIILRMRSLSYNLMKARKIDFSFRADESLQQVKLPMDMRRNFYLIFKEALNNLVKYSNASRASVALTLDGKSVTCVIRDDGIGFDVQAKYNGNGLNNMRRRAREMNARLNIESGSGQGTSVELNLML